MSQEALGTRTLAAGSDLLAYRRLKLDGSQNYVYAGVGEEFIAISMDNVLSGQDISGALRSAGRTFKCVASGAISAGAAIYGDASGKVSASSSGISHGIALEAASADLDVIECIFNNGAGASIDGLATAVTPDAGNGAIPIIFCKQAITDAHMASLAIVTMPFKARIIDWWVVSRDTTAANIKLQNGVTDATAVVAKGATNDAIVQGSSIIAAQKDVASGTVLNVNASIAAGFDIFVMVIKVA